MQTRSWSVRKVFGWNPYAESSHHGMARRLVVCWHRYACQEAIEELGHLQRICWLVVSGLYANQPRIPSATAPNIETLRGGTRPRSRKIEHFLRRSVRDGQITDRDGAALLSGEPGQLLGNPCLKRERIDGLVEDRIDKGHRIPMTTVGSAHLHSALINTGCIDVPGCGLLQAPCISKLLVDPADRGGVGVSAAGSVVDCGRFVGSLRTTVVVGAAWVDKLGVATALVRSWLTGW